MHNAAEALTFFVPGPAVGKQRPRVTAHGTFTPTKTREYERRIGRFYAAKATKRREDFTGPVDMSIVIGVPIPQYVSAKKRIAMLSGSIEPLNKPDIDNVAKSVLDALNGLAYADDKQVRELRVQKRYADVPGVTVTLHWWLGGVSDERVSK